MTRAKAKLVLATHLAWLVKGWCSNCGSDAFECSCREQYDVVYDYDRTLCAVATRTRRFAEAADE